MNIFVECYRISGQPTNATTQAAIAAKAARLRTRGRLYLCDANLQWLAQHFEHVACALGQLIQEAHAVTRPRPLAGPRHLAAADQADVRAGVVGGATGAGGDPGGAGAGAAGDAGEAGGLEGFGPRPGRQEGGAPVRQPRRARLRAAQQRGWGTQ